MANDLYRQFGGQQAKDSLEQSVMRVNQLVDSYRGNPFEQANELIKNGKITQEQWERAIETARQIVPRLGRT